VRRLIEQALRLDDRSAEAWAMLGLLLTGSEVRFSPNREEDLRNAEDAVSRALSLDPRNVTAHAARGTLLYERRRLDEAMIEFQSALAIDRNLSGTQAQLGSTKIVLGRPLESFVHIDAAMRLSPRDPRISMWQMFRGVAHLQLEEDEAALDWLARSVRLNPGGRFGRLFYASALAVAGREDEARVQMAEFRKLAPDFTLARMKQVEPSDEPAFLAQRQRIYEGLRRAGLPE
jgi:tetratricopeptide (TPR) repeat protein